MTFTHPSQAFYALAWHPHTLPLPFTPTLGPTHQAYTLQLQEEWC